MGNSAIGRGTAVEDFKVKASSADATPGFLDAKVGGGLSVAADLLVATAGTSAFQVRQASSQDNIAIGVNQLVWNSEIFDLGNDFASNTFTAPVTGKYQFDCHIRLNSWDSAAGNYQLGFSMSNRAYATVTNGTDLSVDGINDLGLSVLADMDAGDTCVANVSQSSGTVQTDIIGGTDSSFSGFLVV